MLIYLAIGFAIGWLVGHVSKRKAYEAGLSVGYGLGIQDAADPRTKELLAALLKNNP